MVLEATRRHRDLGGVPGCGARLRLVLVVDCWLLIVGCWLLVLVLVLVLEQARMQLSEVTLARQGLGDAPVGHVGPQGPT